ncbi:MAG: DUF2332 family protein, partial [Deinococcus-Thermus bacterium]|nr:DUF2332 family protein [Deinococcota bacterium]
AIAARSGCDRRPIAVTESEQRLQLMSYLWPDQPERLARTEAALAIARADPPALAAADAVDWLALRLAPRMAGHVHVIAHTIVWQYLPVEARAAGDRLIAEAGARADAEAPLARLAMEHDGDPDGAALTLDLWPDGGRQCLGRVDFHGRWIVWKGEGGAVGA